LKTSCRAAKKSATDLETNHSRDVLRSTGWRVRGSGGAADRLGLKPTTLESRMARLGIAGHQVAFARSPFEPERRTVTNNPLFAPMLTLCRRGSATLHHVATFHAKQSSRGGRGGPRRRPLDRGWFTALSNARRLGFASAHLEARYTKCVAGPFDQDAVRRAHVLEGVWNPELMPLVFAQLVER